MFTSDINFDDPQQDNTVNRPWTNPSNATEFKRTAPDLGSVSVKNGVPTSNAQKSKHGTLQMWKYLKLGLLLAVLWVVAVKVPFINKKLPKFMK